MKKAGALLAVLAGLYSALAAIITLIVLGGIGSSASVELRGVWLGWAGLALSFIIIILGAICTRTTSQKPIYLLLLCALTGAVISETFVSLCMASAFFSGLIATRGHFSMPLPSFDEEKSLAVSPMAIDR
jgi:hypothetical protein